MIFHTYLVLIDPLPRHPPDLPKDTQFLCLSLCLSFLLPIEPRVFYIFSILEKSDCIFGIFSGHLSLSKGLSSWRENCSCWQPQSPACSSLPPYSSKPDWLPRTVPTIPAALLPQGLRTSRTVFHLLPDVC